MPDKRSKGSLSLWFNNAWIVWLLVNINLGLMWGKLYLNIFLSSLVTYLEQGSLINGNLKYIVSLSTLGISILLFILREIFRNFYISLYIMLLG